jgi:hypothetical protein
MGKLSQAFVEDDAILEGGVHPLAVEGHDGMGSVADEGDLVPVRPGRTTNRHE